MLERENMLEKSGLEQATLSLFPTTNWPLLGIFFFGIWRDIEIPSICLEKDAKVFNVQIEFVFCKVLI